MSRAKARLRVVLDALLAALTLFHISDQVVAQESFGKCATVMVSPRSPPNPEIIHSPDGSHLARIEFQLVNGMPRRSVKVFKLETGRQYVFVGEVQVLEVDELPYQKFVSNDGRYVVLGELVTFKANVDRVSIYDQFGKHAHDIAGKDVFSGEQLNESRLKYEASELCAPSDPWICWHAAASLNSDNKLEVVDTLGGLVEIDLASGQVLRVRNRGRSCMLFEG